MKKRILVVCYHGQDKYFKKVLKRLSEDITVKVTSKKRSSFLDASWDLILCTSEPYEVHNISSNEDQVKNFQFFNQARKLYPDKKVYRLGFLARKEETLSFIDLHCSLSVLREKIVNILN